VGTSVTYNGLGGFTTAPLLLIKSKLDEGEEKEI